MIRRIPRTQLVRQPLSLAAAQIAQTLASVRPSSTRDDTVATLTRALRALVSAELALKPEHIRAIVEQELGTLRRAAEMVLRIHPEDRHLLDEALTYRERLELACTPLIVGDESIERGGCILVSNLGELDARTETRISIAVELLRSGAFDAR